MTKNKLPTVSKELLKHLDQQIPPKDYKPDATIEEVMFYSGKRALIAYLRTINERKD
jgi:hypothetical protein